MLSRWDPMREMMSMRSQMDRVLNDWLTTAGGWREGESGGMHHLLLDVSESDEAYNVCASIPGIKPEDLNISVQNNTLTIQGETKQEQDREGEQWHLRERRYGQFQRTITLPTNIEPDQIGAEYTDGVLTLTLPKSRESMPRKINVRSGSRQEGTAQRQESNGSQEFGSRQTIEEESRTEEQ
jgi:HSP20 family protein